jgi:hypothetical protein
MKSDLSREDEIYILSILLEKAGAPHADYPYTSEFIARELFATSDFEAGHIRLFGPGVLTPLGHIPIGGNT